MIKSSRRAIVAGLVAFAGAETFAAGARTYPDSDRCWTAGAVVAGVAVNYAEVENPATNYTILHESRRFAEVKGMGVVVTNGTFFDARQDALGKILVPGEPPYAYVPPTFATPDGRSVDLDERWGVGVRKDKPFLEVVRDTEAVPLMATYLGGGGILLKDGADVTDWNWHRGRDFGPSFPDEYRTRVTGRTALGIRSFGDGHQTLLVVGVPPWSGANVRQVAQILRALGASDAVFYDGGGAAAFAAGPPNGRREILVRPTNAGEDLNPTHIVIAACQ